jgi:hypothetical protein
VQAILDYPQWVFSYMTWCYTPRVFLDCAGLSFLIVLVWVFAITPMISKIWAITRTNKQN